MRSHAAHATDYTHTHTHTLQLPGDADGRTSDTLHHKAHQKNSNMRDCTVHTPRILPPAYFTPSYQQLVVSDSSCGVGCAASSHLQICLLPTYVLLLCPSFRPSFLPSCLPAFLPSFLLASFLLHRAFLHCATLASHSAHCTRPEQTQDTGGP